MAQVTGTISSTMDVFSTVREMAIEFHFMPDAKITGNISARIRFLRKVMLEGSVCKRAYFRHQQSVLEWILVGMSKRRRRFSPTI